MYLWGFFFAALGLAKLPPPPSPLPCVVPCRDIGRSENSGVPVVITLQMFAGIYGAFTGK